MRKKVGLLMAGSFAAFCGFAQTATNKLEQSGNAGVGTTNPSHQLEVQGAGNTNDGILVSTSSYASVPFPGSLAERVLVNARGLHLSTDGLTISGAYQPSFGIGVSMNRSAPAMALRNPGGPSLVVEAGNVGIGTNNPGKPLHVVGANGDAALAISTPSWNGIYGSDFTALDFTYGSGVANKIARISAQTINGGGGNLSFQTPTGGTSAPYSAKMTILREGNVGIGTDNPLHKLEVSTESNEILEAIRIGSNAEGYNGAKITFKGAGGANVGQIEGSYSSATATGDLLFRGFQGGEGLVNRMVIKGNGSVGIGTSSPEALLHIKNGSSPASAMIGSFTAPGATGIQLGISAASNGYGFVQSISATGSSFGSIAINPSGGSVGIGTSNPGTYLTAVGNDNGTGNATFRLTNNYGRSIGQYVALNFAVDAQSQNSLGGFYFTNVGGGTALHDFSIKMWDGMGAAPERLYIKGSDGNVGIGTANPQSKLAVNGDIFSKKVRVTQTGWPDYVFHPAYKLPSLQETEDYIRQNSHLPGVVSAKEVEKDGLDIGENQAVLLKKIEELTLYVIDLKKEVDALKAKSRNR